MTLIKQDLEIAALADAISTYLTNVGLGTIPISTAFEVGNQIVPPLLSLYYLPSGPDPFQLGDTTERIYKRVLQIDGYMESHTRASLLIDTLMDYLDTMVVLVKDPLQNNAVVGSVTCQDTDSIYGQNVTPNFEKPKVIRWRAIVRVTIEAHYPNG